MSNLPPENNKPRLLFVGPMIGRHPGYLTMQGLVLSQLFEKAGYPVHAVSDSLNRYRRLADIATRVIRRRNLTDIMMLEVYAGASFVVEDVASFLGKRLGMRIIMTVHPGNLPEFIARFPRWSRRVFSRADALVVPSPFLARTLAEAGFSATIIPNVIDLSAYTYRHRTQVRPRMFWMRSFYPYYNPLMAIRVLARLRPVYPDATLVMAGKDKGMEEETRRLAAELGLADAVRFPGFLDVAGKTHEYNEADIYVNTNNVDNTPIAVVEAGAAGVPIVATAVGGVPDLLTHEETGLLVPDDDDEAMAAAVRRLLEDPALAAKLSVNSRKLAERSAWEGVRPQWEQKFAEVLALDRRRTTDDGRPTTEKSEVRSQKTEISF